MATLCLSMIVKNEAHVIRRCLASVKPVIDAWVIVDTGSTDGTQDLVRECLADLPGELLERPWVDFATNRNQALELARTRADYVLVIDADERLETEPGFAMPSDGVDGYNVVMRFGDITYVRKQVVRAALPWRYVGVVHEYLTCPEAKTEAPLHGIRTLVTQEGARSRDPNTYRRDALQLERALIEEPDNTRYVFYLAQAWAAAGENELALRWYRRRAGMGGWREEVWHALYQIGRVQERLGVPRPEVAASYLAAWEHTPDRAEPLYRVGTHHQAKREFHLSHLFLGRALSITHPQPHRLFVEHTLYEIHIPFEYAVACFYVGQHEEAIRVNDALLAQPSLAPELRDKVKRNRKFSIDALKQP